MYMYIPLRVHIECQVAGGAAQIIMTERITVVLTEVDTGSLGPGTCALEEQSRVITPGFPEIRCSSWESDCSIVGSISGPPCSRKVPHCVQAETRNCETK